MSINYSMDEYYGALKNKTRPSEYPYGIILSNNNYMIRGILQNTYSISEILSQSHVDVPYRFSFFNILNKQNQVVDASNTMLSKYFHNNTFIRVADIHPIYEFNITTASTAWSLRGSDIREYIKSGRNPSCLYSSTVDLDDEYTLTPMSSKKVSKTDSLYLRQSALIFDPNMDYAYMSNSKFNKMLMKDIDDGSVCVDSLYTNAESYLKIEINHLYVNSLHFNNVATMKRYHKYFIKHFKKDYPVILSSYADDPINVRVNKISSLRDHITVIVGAVHNHSKNYEVVFDWNIVDDYDMYNDIVTGIQIGDFYTDTPVSTKSLDKLCDHYIYINEERFVNKIKIVKKWKDCIKEIIVNSEGAE